MSLGDNPRIKLSELLPAKSEARHKLETAEAVNGGPSRNMVNVSRILRARLVAQEYVRNGMDLEKAYITVTKRKPKGNSKRYTNLSAMFPQNEDVFIEELSGLLKNTDIDRDAALNILWSMIHISLLDYFDDHGNVLPIADLKRLPRIYQIMLSEIDIHSKQETVRGDDGKVMIDDTGSPYLKTVQRVKIKIPDKQAALNQLAQVMKWIGPTTVNNNHYVGIGTIMAQADERQRRTEQVYEGTYRAIPKEADAT